ncbi:SNF2 family N-terminal domain-containing protein [Irpex rosettiformis]|uniref:SNF2 family N-terminal domain-containing protein n=1 Tax=Irpex rosettiformis TaxID=378272 RepID=A0ACB8TZI2_9APHY|nr:SNF2 family N-terminal domain-containing protein [Irpex rosettiformis]
MSKGIRNEKARRGQGMHKGASLLEDAEERMKEDRESLIRERQGAVDEVLDRHDSLVRELFHLEKYVSLLSYNPQEAKLDKSAVFMNFKSSYDLVGHTAAAGPSRATRSAHTQRLQSLQTGSVTNSVASSSKKHKVAHEPEERDGMLWTLLAEVNAKAKGKEPATAHTVSAPVVRRGRPPKSAQPKGPTPVNNKDYDAHLTRSTAPLYRRRTVIHPPAQPPPAKKRKLDIQTNGHDVSRSVSMSNTKFPAGKRRRPVGVDVAHVQEEEELSISASVGPLKRIKLIVRKPPPVYTHPLQRPPLPRFGSSLESYLKSYMAPDGVDLDDNTLKDGIQRDLVIWRQIDDMRRRGYMLHRPPEGSSGCDSGALGPERAPDLWDQIILEVGECHRIQHHPTGNFVASQVASRVKGYWEAQAIRDDKAKALEDKRLRALAKATIRLVTTKWKEAVYYIRDQERKKREDEERRRGHEHLDAILDQSGHILEAQHVDLARTDGLSSRSRSGSLPAGLEHWASATSPAEGFRDLDNSDSDDKEDDEDDSDDEDVGPDEAETHQLLSQTDNLPGDNWRSRETSLDGFRRSVSSPADEDESWASSRRPSVSFAEHEAHISPPAPDFTRHRSSSLLRFEIIDTNEENTTIGFKKQAQWHKERSIPSPISQIVELPESTSSRSSVVPESIPELQHDHLDDFLDTTDDLPPDTPTSIAFDTISIPPIPKEEELTSTLVLNSNATPVIDHTPSNNKPIIEADDVVDEDNDLDEEIEDSSPIPPYLRPYAVAPVTWDSDTKVKPPLLLRGTLRPYQQAGLEWLASLHTNHLNGILADEMGLGKTIQTISLLAHLACDRGIWGPHLIIVPTSVLLNWEMEFKKFLPGFKVLSYHGNTKRRKELRQGWNNKYHFNVCVTSYTLASRDAHVFKRKAWYYMILDEAHMIKNFKSQRWNILLMFRSFRRLLLTGTPLQNNLTELWALLQFLMSGTDFANLKEFGEWFSNPLEKAIEMGSALDNDNLQRVAKLHQVLRPYLLRRLKRDVEKELPSKFEHLVMCPLSKRQRFLYDEFMARAETRHDLQSGVYQKIANILMQLRKVVNHPDLFEVRPITTSFAMPRSAIADFEIKELLVRRELLRTSDEDKINLDLLGFHFAGEFDTSIIAAHERSRLDGTSHLPLIVELPEAPPKDARTIEGFLRYKAYMQRLETAAHWKQIAYVNRLRCQRVPLFCSEVIKVARIPDTRITPLSLLDNRQCYLDTVHAVHAVVKSHRDRQQELASVVDRFAFATPVVVARDMPSITLAGHANIVQQFASNASFDGILHPSSVKLQIAFPDPSLLQYDCGKLQELARLLRERKDEGHRVLIFTQMTRVLDILETFLNHHGYLYLRLDGATKIEDRQYITERFNTDSRIFCFISSSRSGGVGINLTGADTVIFYDSDFNPQMDRQCEDRAHRIGQIRDVHIYRFISQHTVEEALLRKANQKRSLDDIVIQKGEFDWRTLFRDEGALTKALGEVEDTEDAHAAAVAAKEEIKVEGADAADFAWEGSGLRIEQRGVSGPGEEGSTGVGVPKAEEEVQPDANPDVEDAGEEEEGGTTEDYMLAFVQADMEFFGEWRLPGFKE